MGWFDRTPLRVELSPVIKTSFDDLSLGIMAGAGLTRRVADVFVGEVGFETGYAKNALGESRTNFPVVGKFGVGLYGPRAEMALTEIFGGIDAAQGNGILGLGVNLRLPLHDLTRRTPFFILPFCGASLRYNWTGRHGISLLFSVGAFSRPNVGS